MLTARELVTRVRLGGRAPHLPPVLQSAAAEESLRAVAEAVQTLRVRPITPWGDIDADGVRREATRFHSRAGTLTPVVAQCIDMLLLQSYAILRIAHTPDLLPYLAVALLPVLMNVLADELLLKGVPTVQVFLVIDADESADLRVRTAIVPSATRSDGELRLRVPPSSSRHRVLAYAEKPTEEVIRQWQTTLRDHSRSHLALLGAPRVGHVQEEVVTNLTELSADLSYAQAAATSLGDFSAIFLSRLVNLHWRLPTVFIPQIAVAPFMYPVLAAVDAQLARIRPESVRAVENLNRWGIETPSAAALLPDSPQYWLVCRRCGRRTSMADVRKPAHGECVSCGRRYLIDIGRFPGPEDPIVVPKVRIDSLLDVVAWGAQAGTSYVGSSEHCFVTMETLACLGIPFIDVLWTPSVRRLGPVQEALRVGGPARAHLAPSALAKSEEMTARIRLGRASIVYHTLYEGFESIRQSWDERLRNYGLNAALET